MDWKNNIRKNLRPGLLIPFGLSYVWFFLLERLHPQPLYWVHSPLDGALPFVAAFIIPYVSWYVYVFGMLLWYMARNSELFTRLIRFMSAGMLFSCLVYTVLPNGQQLRPEQLGGDVFSRIVALLYAIDTPTNSLPSVHVIFAVGAHITVMRSPAAKTPARVISLALCVLICVSTMLVKQHSVLCVAAGLAVAAADYALFYRDTRLVRLGRKTERIAQGSAQQ